MEKVDGNAHSVRPTGPPSKYHAWVQFPLFKYLHQLHGYPALFVLVVFAGMDWNFVNASAHHVTTARGVLHKSRHAERDAESVTAGEIQPNPSSQGAAVTASTGLGLFLCRYLLF